MRKSISSLFMLIILLLSLWSISALLLGKNNQQNLHSLINENSVNPDALFSYELINYSSSIFGGKAIVAVSANNDNAFSNSVAGDLDAVLFDIDINNGPIIIHKTKPSLGNSAWIISLNDQNNFEYLKDKTELYKLKQWPSAYLVHTFDNSIEYSIPIESQFSDIIIKGIYDLKKAVNTGSIKSKNLHFNQNKYALKIDDLNLRYILQNHKSNNKDSEKKLYLKAENTPFRYKHINMTKPLNVNLNYNGAVSFKNNKINSENTVEVDNIEPSSYPLDNAKYSFDVSDLHLQKFNDLSNHLSQIKNLQQQIQWVLEEQGELPEGQDQIWQLQDQISRYDKKLDNIIHSFSTNEDISDKNNENNRDSVFLFSGIHHYKNQQSKLKGSIDFARQGLPKEKTTELSLNNLTQVNAEVSLDDLHYEFISAQIPIKKNQFKLIYKQNKLLMQ